MLLDHPVSRLCAETGVIVLSTGGSGVPHRGPVSPTGSSGGTPDHPVCTVLLERVFKPRLSLSHPHFFHPVRPSVLSLLLLGAPVCILPIHSERLRIDDRRAGTSSSRSSPPIRASFSCFVGRIPVSKVCSVLSLPFASLTRLRC